MPATLDRLEQRKIKRYGWKPDLPDARDEIFALDDPEAARSLPVALSLRDQMPEPYDQLPLGSCTANAIAAACEHEQIKQGFESFTPSRLFIYYGERVIEGSVDQDAGAFIRDGMKIVSKLGVPPETLWPYDINRFAEQPPADAFAEALNHQVMRYRRVIQQQRQIMLALAAGFPVVFGFTVYESFESEAVARSGLLPMPQPSEQMLGGHAVLCIGYDTTRGPGIIFEVRNSWGTSWGDRGHFWMPGSYMLDRSLSSDLWTVRLIEGTKLADAA